MKSLAAHGVLYGVFAVLILGLSACNVRPVLSVDPSAVTLNDSSGTVLVRISNEGSGTLNWTAESDAPWLELAPETEDLWSSGASGSTAVSGALRLRMNKNLLPDDQESLRATIRINSNGGAKEVAVAVQRLRVPVLGVSPEILNFGEESTRQLLEVLNEGDAVLQWSLQVPDTASWLSVSPASGSVSRQSAAGVDVVVNRGLLAPSQTPYRARLVLQSNAGNKTVDVFVTQSAFVATPQAVAFGPLPQPATQLIKITTQSAEAVPVNASIPAAAGWLSVDSASVSVTRTRPYDLRLTADPRALTPGDYSATVILTHTPTSRTQNIAVSMTVLPPTSYSLVPGNIDFGETRTPVQRTVRLTNLGASAINWNIEKPAENSFWLSVEPASGVLETTVDVVLTADPANLKAGTASLNLTVYAGGLSQLLPVRITRPKDPIPNALQVEPRVLDFGSLTNHLDVSIWNDGENNIDWAVLTAGLPAWMTIDPLSGQVGGTRTQNMRVSIDRDLAPQDTDFSHTFAISSSVPGAAPVEVFVSGEPRRLAQIEIVGEGADANNVPFIIIEIGKDTEVFTIFNHGNADLNWDADLALKPNWITAVSPQQGTIKPGRQQVVQVTTNRAGLTQTGGYYQLPIRSNDPEMPVAPLDINVRVPYKIVIGARPGALNFGRVLSTLPLEIANLGDAGWPLDFVITSNHPEWIFVEPMRGRSIGTASPIKDWQFISIAIDRSRIETAGAAAKLTIAAENVPPNASPVAPVEVDISVDLSELNIEAAYPRFRRPSLIRFSLLLRDVGQRIFPEFEDGFIPGRTLYRLNNMGVQMLEDSEPIDLTETNVFVKKDETLGFAVLIMLDYSGSMKASAEAMVKDGQLDPGGRDPLDALYLQTIGPMLREFPAHYRVALSVFNERRPLLQENSRIITGAPLGYPETLARQNFVADKDILQYRLENTQVEDNGATPLYVAVLESAFTFLELDATMPDFDAANEQILIAVTDGRRTTPPGELSAVKDFLFSNRIRMFAVGFGANVLANPLIQMSTETGGHYYATRNRAVPGAFNEQGDPLTVPILESLLDVCRTNTAVSGAHSLPRDLRSHVVVSYPTLNEESGFQAQGRVTVSTVEPAVNETFIFDQIPGLDMAGDVRLGQIGLRTTGRQANGAATVQVYADYIPRNIKALQFVVNAVPAQPFAVSLVPAGRGGLVDNWNLSVAGNTITLTAPSGRALSYGDYGNLVDINFAGVVADFTLFFEVTAPVLTGSPDSKYFTCPEKIEVGVAPFVATSFPNPRFTFLPAVTVGKPYVIDVGVLTNPANITRASLFVENVGGEYMPKLASLYWTLRKGAGSLPGTRFGDLNFTYGAPPAINNDIYYLVDPEMEGQPGVTQNGFVQPKVEVADDANTIVTTPGTYSCPFYVDVYYGSLFYLFSHGPYYLQYTVPATAP